MAKLRKLQNPKKKSPDNFVRYSGLAFEMIVLIGAGVFGGIKLDNYLGCKPLFTAVLSLAGVIMAIYFAIKDVIKDPKK